MADLIDRQSAIDVINQLINEFEGICSHIRERNVDDSVCGLCEYDGAYIGQSGDWCNECPGFDKDDCFKLKDEYRQEWLKKLPSAQPERWDTCFSCPLSHGCPIINGCTNDQAEQYAGEIPTDCPLDKEPAQPERTCVNCGRTANNGGWYADGRTRCPIEEHYALPKDGYCHLWEKRSVTDDDCPERREK